MKLWSDLLATALLGTSRAPLPAWPEDDAPLDALLRGLDREPPARALLSAAAAVHTWRRAGRQPLLTRASALPPAPEDIRSPCASRAAACLSEILRTGDKRLLAEWLRLLASHGAALPRRWLPELLDVACSESELRPLIEPLIGARGRWLAAQHPGWRSLLLPGDPDAVAERWETGTVQARLDLLRQLRAADPGRARDLVAATWGQDAARNRARLAEVFAVGLSPADEPFLEGLLADRSRQVRSVAADLLAHLPASRLAERMADRLRSLLTVESGFLQPARLAVALPRAYTPEMSRDGIVEKLQGTGKRAWWMVQMLAALPPAHWARAWGRSPAELIALAARTDDAWVLFEGWSRAAARQRDAAWAEALLKRWFDEPWTAPASWRSPYLKQDLGELTSSVPQARLEAWLSACLKAHRSALTAQDALLALLQRHERSWGESLTRDLLCCLRAAAGSKDGPGPRWRMALPDLAYCACPARADDAKQGWPEDGPWAKLVQHFFATLRFRRRMSSAFLEEAS